MPGAEAGKPPDGATAFGDMWTYAGVRHGERRLNFQVDGRSEETFVRLYGRLPEAEGYFSDDYGMYGAWLPPQRRRKGKGGPVNWNGGHSRLRSKLNRLVRQTKGYGKDAAMLAGPVALVCLRLGLMQ